MNEIQTPCMGCGKETLWILGATIKADSKGILKIFCMDCRERGNR